ncbi:GNAT family N-acetyltransferase [Pollutibacter soli]|uniref:GNAT family N-acetyltransferase n=1 Tax=Pollutibacter soli TaxID=3034157 RepID=UPI003013E5EF
MTIRAAVNSDLSRLLEFEQGIVATERPFDPTLKPGEIHYYDLGELIKSPDSMVAVAELNGELIGSGYAKIKIADDFLQHKEFAYLGCMYVEPEHRGKGVIQAITDYLFDWVRQRGLSEVRLDVYAENKTAVNSYTRMGFTPNLLEMRIALQPE